jgi:hypothetical protein
VPSSISKLPPRAGDGSAKLLKSRTLRSVRGERAVARYVRIASNRGGEFLGRGGITGAAALLATGIPV